MHTLAEQVFSARVALSSIDGPGADRRIQDHVPLLLEPRVSPIFFFSGLGPDPGGGGGGGGGVPQQAAPDDARRIAEKAILDLHVVTLAIVVAPPLSAGEERGGEGNARSAA